MSKMRFKQSQVLWITFGFALLLRLIAMPFSQTCDADAVTRTFMAIAWLEDPHLITYGVWAPLHQYFNAFALIVIPDQIWGPKLLHVIFGAALVIPVFKLSRRHLDITTSALVALFISLSPVIFRNSFHSLSGIPFLFFLGYSLYWVIRASTKEGNWKEALYAGLMITVASGLRYEGWVVMTMFVIILFLKKKWINAFVFGAAAGIFPLFWMIGNYWSHGDLLYFLEGSRLWNFGAENHNSWISDDLIMMRRIFFSYSFLLSMTPWVFIALMVGLVKTWKKIKFKNELWIFCLPFLIILAVFTHKSIDGTLFTQHRFTSLLILLFVPIMILALQSFSRKWLYRIAPIMIIGAWMMSFAWGGWKIENWFGHNTFRNAIGNARVWTTNQLEAVPTIPSDEPDEILDILEKELDEDETLIMDFLGWRETYYIALRSRLPRDDFYIVPGGKAQTADFERLRNLLNDRESTSGIFIRSKKKKPKMPKGLRMDIGEGMVMVLSDSTDMDVATLFHFVVERP